MINIPVKGLQKFSDRHGRRRVYHRPTGIPITADEGTAAFFLQIMAAEMAAEIIKRRTTKADASGDAKAGAQRSGISV